MVRMNGENRSPSQLRPIPPETRVLGLTSEWSALCSPPASPAPTLQGHLLSGLWVEEVIRVNEWPLPPHLTWPEVT